MTVREIEERMDSRELSEWAAFFNMENKPEAVEINSANALLGIGATKKAP